MSYKPTSSGQSLSNDITSCLKFKSSNKIAAYDIDFFGIERNAHSSSDSTDQSNSHKNTTTKSEISLEQNSPTNSEAHSTETLHQDLFIDSKKNNLAILTDSIDGSNRAISLEPSANHLFFSSSSSITYKSKHFVLVIFILLFFTLLPLQYHNQNFLVQIKKMQDSCTESKGYFNENQTYILDTIFPYGFSSGLEFSSLNHQLNLLNKIQQSKSRNNYTIKYMNQQECKLNNLTNMLNIVTIPDKVKTTTKRPFVVDSQFVASLQIRQKKYLKQRGSNVILICDDEIFKRSQSNSNLEKETYFADNFDIKANVLTHVSRILINFLEYSQ